MSYGSRYFSPAEFSCSDGCGLGSKEADVAPDLIYGLHILRARLGTPFKITSGARCVKHNTSVGGGVRSTHLQGVKGQCTPEFEGMSRAADVDTSSWTGELRLKAIQLAAEMGMRVGLGETFLHFDVEREPLYRNGSWNYGYKENSSNIGG